MIRWVQLKTEQEGNDGLVDLIDFQQHFSPIELSFLKAGKQFKPFFKYFDGLPDVPYFFESNSHIQVHIRIIMLVNRDALIKVKDAVLILANIEQTRS